MCLRLTRTHSVAKEDLELLVLLPQLPEHWDHKYEAGV